MLTLAMATLTGASEGLYELANRLIINNRPAPNWTRPGSGCAVVYRGGSGPGDGASGPQDGPWWSELACLQL